MKQIDKFKKLASKGYQGFEITDIVIINRHKFSLDETKNIIVHEILYTDDCWYLEDYLTPAATMKIINKL